MPKLEKSTNYDHGQNSSEGCQDTSACKISGHSLHAFSRKCLETPSLTYFTKLKWHQKKKNYQTMPKIFSSEGGQDTSACKISGHSLPAFPLRTDERTGRKTVTVGRMDQRTHVQVERGYFGLRTDGRTDGKPENIMPPAPKGRGIKMTLEWVHKQLITTAHTLFYFLYNMTHPYMTIKHDPHISISCLSCSDHVLSMTCL